MSLTVAWRTTGVSAKTSWEVGGSMAAFRGPADVQRQGLGYDDGVAVVVNLGEERWGTGRPGATSYLPQRLSLGAQERVGDGTPPQLRVAHRRSGLVEEVQGRLPVGSRAHPERGVQILGTERVGQESERQA